MSDFTPGRRPTISEIREYYQRDDILDELLLGMQKWHVRFVPGCENQSWLYTEDSSVLSQRLDRVLDKMEADPNIVDYPYFRINHARYTPAHSWEASSLWGFDFVIEKDSPLWQECFEAMLPVMDILEYFGVYYWLKYTGHHSLHLIVPAEVFPPYIGHIPLTSCYAALYHRLMVFLNKRSHQHFNEHDRHCPPGTNMPYTVNEDTGLVNLPLKRKDLAAFRPWHTNIHMVEPQDFWRSVPENAWGTGQALVDEVLKPFQQQKRHYAGKSQNLHLSSSSSSLSTTELAENPRIQDLCLSQEQAVKQLNSKDSQERQHAAWSLMILSPPGIDYEMVINALCDDNADVRWFAAELLARAGPLRALKALFAMRPDDMAGAALVDFCCRYRAVTIPALIQALCSAYKSPYTSLPFDRALVRIGVASVPFLTDLQKHTNRSVRKIAGEILYRINGTPELEDVLAMSQKQNQKSDAARMLGWFDDPPAHQCTTILIEDMRNDRLRRECVKSLLWNDHPDEDTLLEQALQDTNRKIRNWAQQYIYFRKQLKLLQSSK